MTDLTILEKGIKSFKPLWDNIQQCAILILNAEGIIIDANPSTEILTGYTENEVVGQHFAILYDPNNPTIKKADMDLKKMVSSESFNDIRQVLRKDGSNFLANLSFLQLRAAQEHLLGFGLIIQDRSETAKQHQALLTQLEKSQSEVLDYKQALDESAIVAITDQKGVIHHVNDNFCKISKYTRDELIGQDHRIINSTFHSKEFIRNLWLTIASGRIWRGELRNKAKDGTYYWVDTTIVPFLNDKGKPYQYLAIRSDITQRKEAEAALHKLNDELEQKIKERTLELTQALEREKELNEMKSRFVSIASHEFRTPLSAILSSISLLQHYNSPEQAEKRQKHIDRIKSSVKNLTSILDDFLSLEKLEQGKVEINYTTFNLQNFIQNVVEEVDGFLKRKNQQLHFTYEGLPEIYLDKKILHNVLLNLLSNAVKYSPEERGIHVKATVDETKVSITVQDEGIGIPQEAQKNLFGKFFRAHNATNIEGTGLGLNIVKRYIELLEGTIFFTSEENKGTTFTVIFSRRTEENNTYE